MACFWQPFADESDVEFVAANAAAVAQAVQDAVRTYIQVGWGAHFFLGRGFVFGLLFVFCFFEGVGTES